MSISMQIIMKQVGENNLRKHFSMMNIKIKIYVIASFYSSNACRCHAKKEGYNSLEITNLPYLVRKVVRSQTKF